MKRRYLSAFALIAPVFFALAFSPAATARHVIFTNDSVTGNLISDPGFESGVAGFAAQESTDSVTRSTVNPIAGSASLRVAINGWGNNVFWTLATDGTANAHASQLTVSGKLRGDTTQSNSTLQFCAAAYYTDSGDIVQNCAEASNIAGQIVTLTASLDLDATRTLASIDIRMTLDGPGPVVYAVDDVSAVLTVVDVPPPVCTQDTWSCSDWSACSASGNQTRTCTMTFDCPNVVTPSPPTSQFCDGSGPPPSAGYTAVLTDSGSTAPLPLIADAQDPAEPNLTPAFHVSTPNAQCSKLTGFINPAIAIPTTSNIREVEATWNGTPLPLIDPQGKEVAEEAHAWGSMVGFFKPLFSLAAVPAGAGTLEVKAFDGSHNSVTSAVIPNLTVFAPPPARTAAQIGALGHPRIYLTPARLAQIAAKPASDLTAQRFWSNTTGVGYFLDALNTNPDPTSTAFANQVYDPDGYIPALALCYQLKKNTDTATATKCAGAAKTLTLRMANDYASGARDFGRDSGYDIRFDLRDMMLAYDWMYDQFSPTDRALLVRIATQWVDWYRTTPGYASTQPVENYYAGYLQGIALASVATAGDNSDADRLLALLRAKLTDEVPVLNQRGCGGDYAEGWNYGPYTMLEFSLVNQTLKDIGEDWSADFDFVDKLTRSYTYQVSPDYLMTVSFGDYSGDYAHLTRPWLLAVLSSTTADSALAARLYSTMMAAAASDIHVPLDRPSTFYEIVFGNLAQTADVSPMPLSYLNPGTGRWFSQSSLTDTSGYQATAEVISYQGDHYGYSNGDVQLFHGSTCILCSAAYRGDRFIGLGQTKDYSTYLVNGAGSGVSRNAQVLFNQDTGTWSAVGMRFESSYPKGRYDENLMSPDMPLDYLIREAVHLRPGVLVVRDLHRRRHADDTLVANWHLGSAEAVQTLSAGHYKIGTTDVTAFTNATIGFGSDADAGGNRIGTLMTQTFPTGVQGMESVTVFAEGTTGVSYASGVLKLSNGQCVTFANGSVSVASCQ